MEKKKLLYIDDQSYMHQLLSHGAREVGCDFTAVKTVRKAVEALDVEAFDVILTDIALEGGEESGLDFIRIVRQERGIQNIPIIILSMYDDQSAFQKGVDYGVDDYILKPFQMKRIKESITRWLYLSRHKIDWAALSPKQARLTRLTMSTIGSTFTAARTGEQVSYQSMRTNCLSLLQAGQDNGIVSALSELKDHDVGTYLHCVKYAAYLGMVAAKQGAGEGEFLDIVTSGLLHDIGISRIPSSFLEQERWQEDEQRWFIKAHIEAGKDVIQSQKEPFSELCQVVMTCHHERLDGSGPLKKKGGQLSDIVRMATVVESFVTLRDGLHSGGRKTNYPFDHLEADAGLDQRFVALLKETQGGGSLGTPV
jgi:response regulator RpfG family c-di-GMP phosphodiesterase